MHLPGPALGAPSPGIAHTIPSSVWINTAATATEWRAIVLFFFRRRGGATENIMTYFWNARRLYVTSFFFFDVFLVAPLQYGGRSWECPSKTCAPSKYRGAQESPTKISNIQWSRQDRVRAIGSDQQQFTFASKQVSMRARSLDSLVRTEVEM